MSSQYSQLGEFYSLTTNDGQVLTLPNQQVAFVETGGFGAPPVTWITKQGYKQHGETEVGYILGKRPIDLKLHFLKAPTRQQYWKNRAFIQDILRHNRLGPMTLTINLPGDTTYDADTFITSGLNIHALSGTLLTVYGSVSGFSVGMAIRASYLGVTEYMLITNVNVGTGGLTVIRQMNGSGNVGALAFAPGAGPFVFYSPVNTMSRQRSIIVRADPGLILPVDQAREANWYIDEALKLVAFNPIWFDPVVISTLIPAASQQNLIFPITFPITFSVSGFLFTTNIVYTGSWYEYPTITLTGPYQAAIISNATTGISFTMNVPLAAGQQRIISTTPGALSVVDQNGVNFFGELGPTSDLVDFNLRPAPEVAGGINNIQVSMLGPGTGAAVNLSFYNRFFGL